MYNLDPELPLSTYLESPDQIMPPTYEQSYDKEQGQQPGFLKPMTSVMDNFPEELQTNSGLNMGIKEENHDESILKPSHSIRSGFDRLMRSEDKHAHVSRSAGAVRNALARTIRSENNEEFLDFWPRLHQLRAIHVWSGSTL